MPCAESTAEVIEHSKSQVEPVDRIWMQSALQKGLSQGQCQSAGAAACIKHAKSGAQQRGLPEVTSEPLLVPDQTDEAIIAADTSGEELDGIGGSRSKGAVAHAVILATVRFRVVGSFPERKLAFGTGVYPSKFPSRHRTPMPINTTPAPASSQNS